MTGVDFYLGVKVRAWTLFMGQLTHYKVLPSFAYGNLRALAPKEIVVVLENSVHLLGFYQQTPFPPGYSKWQAKIRHSSGTYKS